MSAELTFAIYLVKEIIQAKTNIENRIERSVLWIQDQIKQGQSIDALRKQIMTYAQQYPMECKKAYDASMLIEKNKQSQNLLEHGQLYFHRILYCFSAPTRMIIDHQTKIIQRTSEPFEQILKAEFIMKDLIDFFYESSGNAATDHQYKQDAGKFTHLLGRYTLDEILYAIDAAKWIRHDQQLPPLRNAFDLETYIDEARFVIEQKQNARIREKLI